MFFPLLGVKAVAVDVSVASSVIRRIDKHQVKRFACLVQVTERSQVVIADQSMSGGAGAEGFDVAVSG